MFSPSAGSLNSETSLLSEGTIGAGVVAVLDADWVGFAGEGAVSGAAVAGFGSDLAAGTLGARASARLPPAPFSTVTITWPTLIFSPCLTRTSLTVPLT